MIHVLKIQCPDERGIIYRVTKVLYEAGLNVIEQNEFVANEENRFFLRTAFDGNPDNQALLENLRTTLHHEAIVTLRPMTPRRIAILVTREEHCLGDLLLRHHDHELPADITCVIANRPEPGQLTKKFNIPFLHIPHQNKDHATHDREVCQALEPFKPEFVILAKYMRILGQEFISQYPHRIINIHHSSLPAFVGARPYHQAYQRGVKIIGATAHIVSEELDAGPIIAQDTFSVRHSHGVHDLIRAGRNIEKIVLARALRLALEDRIFVHKNRTIIFD